MKKDYTKPSIVLYTGIGGMYMFEFAMGGVGQPKSYYHGYSKHTNYIYISLGTKQSNIKCKVRLSKENGKIEVYNGTKLLFSCNHFDKVYYQLKKLNINILTYNKRLRKYENE